MMMLHVMTFQTLLPLTSLKGLGMTISAYFDSGHFFLSIRYAILSVVPSIFRPTQRKRTGVVYLNYFSRNNSTIVYIENTACSPEWQIHFDD